ncbi:hypothetical protein GCM10010112_83900 [Actinoplanes lobatus]|uniref:Uncharacterized protein n=1 Tax=Actinoplanes lobatus TaxID=113568 RepID=A0ABQ4AVL0_9ACTN|nr:hypothetical protein GCM10010112_83900 [Actinoplanes lobatus]GIE44624.1 hypothetical protein Alo02nite_75220 [Actinoplanes lobatus]
MDGLASGHDTGSPAHFVAVCPSRSRALAAIRILGADTMAGAALPGPDDRAILAEAVGTFAQPGPDPVADWQEWAMHRAAGVAHRIPAGLPFHAGDSWRTFAGALVALSALATPKLDGPLHDAVRDRPADIARGATRATIRRDHPTAAALTRWLVLLQRYGVRVPLDTGLLLDHLRLLGCADARTALDVAVCDRMLR